MALTVQRYKDLKEQGISDSKIRKEFGMHTNAFTAWKRENGLLNEFKKNAISIRAEGQAALEKSQKVLSDEPKMLSKQSETLPDVEDVYKKDVSEFFDDVHGNMKLLQAFEDDENLNGLNFTFVEKGAAE